MSVHHHQIMKHLFTRSCIQRKMETKIALPEIALNIQEFPSIRLLVKVRGGLEDAVDSCTVNGLKLS
jgi:hypothetical protein